MSDKGRSEAESAFLIGDYLARQGDVESARGAFQSAITMRDPEWSPRAAYHLGELLWAVRDPFGAEDALRVAIDARHPEWSPAAEVVQGVICASRQNLAAMHQMAADRRLGRRHDGVQEPKDLSVGRGKGSQRWTAWIRRDRS